MTTPPAPAADAAPTNAFSQCHVGTAAQAFAFLVQRPGFDAERRQEVGIAQ